MDTILERRRGKLSPLLLLMLMLMLMLKLIPGTGTMAIMVTTVPMDTMDTDSMEGSRTSYQDNLRNMILLETKPVLVLSS